MEAASLKKYVEEVLGFRVKDKVTGFDGVATSVAFDLYGCVQVFVDGGHDEKRENRIGHWFDANRLDVTDAERVMPVPEFRRPVEGRVSRVPGPVEKKMAR